MNRKLMFILKIAVGLILISIIFFTVEPKAIWAALKSARFRLVAVGVALMPLNIFLQEYKWRYLVKLVRPDVTFRETMGSLLGGFSLGIATPGRIGEYGRSLFIRDTSPLRLVGLTVIDKFYNLGLTIAIGLPALLTLPAARNLIQGYLSITMFIMLIFLDLVLLYFALDPRPVRSLIYALQMIFPQKGRIAKLLGGLDTFSFPQARKMLLLTLLYYFVYQTQYFFLINGFGSIDPISSTRAASAILFTKSALPIAIGDLGLDQWVSIGFFGEFGISNAQAFNASVLLFAINVLIPALVGLIFIGRLQFNKNETVKGE